MIYHYSPGYGTKEGVFQDDLLPLEQLEMDFGENLTKSPTFILPPPAHHVCPECGAAVTFGIYIPAKDTNPGLRPEEDIVGSVELVMPLHEYVRLLKRIGLRSFCIFCWDCGEELYSIGETDL